MGSSALNFDEQRLLSDSSLSHRKKIYDLLLDGLNATSQPPNTNEPPYVKEVIGADGKAVVVNGNPLTEPDVPKITEALNEFASAQKKNTANMFATAIEMQGTKQLYFYIDEKVVDGKIHVLGFNSETDKINWQADTLSNSSLVVLDIPIPVNSSSSDFDYNLVLEIVEDAVSSSQTIQMLNDKIAGKLDSKNASLHQHTTDDISDISQYVGTHPIVKDAKDTSHQNSQSIVAINNAIQSHQSSIAGKADLDDFNALKESYESHQHSKLIPQNTVHTSLAESATKNGIYPWVNTVEDRPSDWGVLLNISNVDIPTSNSWWLNQLAFGTDGRLYFRKKTNSDSYNTWQKIGWASELDAHTSTFNTFVSLVNTQLLDRYTKAQTDTKIKEVSDHLASMFTIKDGKIYATKSIYTEGAISAMGYDGTSVSSGGSGYPRISDWAQADDISVPSSLLVKNSLAQKSDVGHDHNIADVNGLSSALQGKVPLVPGKSLISDVLIAKIDGAYTNTEIDSKLADKSDSGHPHTTSDISDLNQWIESKNFAQQHTHPYLGVNETAKDSEKLGGLLPSAFALAHAHPYLKLGINNLAETINTNLGLTRTLDARDKAAIMFGGGAKITNLSFYSFWNMKAMNGSAIAFGGIANTLGLFYYKEEQTENKWNTSLKCDMTTGAWETDTQFKASSFVKAGGASNQFLKADGSVDSTTYGTQSDIVAVNNSINSTRNDLFTHIAKFNDMFEIVDGKIHVLKSIYTDGTISALGSASDTASPGLNYGRLDKWEDYRAEDGTVLSSKLGYGLLTRLDALAPRIDLIESNKVDKVLGKSLISDQLVAKITDAYTNTEIDTKIASKSNLEHEHCKIISHSTTGEALSDSGLGNGVYPWASNNPDYPNGWGVVLNLVNTEDSSSQSYWRNQLAFATNGKLYFRQAINRGGYCSWQTLAFLSDIPQSATHNFISDWDDSVLTSITKNRIEELLTGNISTHTHSQYLTEHQSLLDYAKKTDVDSVNSLLGQLRDDNNGQHSTLLNKITTLESGKANVSHTHTYLMADYNGMMTDLDDASKISKGRFEIFGANSTATGLPKAKDNANNIINIGNVSNIGYGWQLAMLDEDGAWYARRWTKGVKGEWKKLAFINEVDLAVSSVNSKVTELKNYLDSLFVVENGKIKANMSLFTKGTISALGSDGTATGGGGGSSYPRLDNWSDFDAQLGAVLSATLGHGIYEQLNSLTPRVALLENNKSDKGHKHEIADVNNLELKLNECKTEAQTALNNHITEFNAYKADAQTALGTTNSTLSSHISDFNNYKTHTHNKLAVQPTLTSSTFANGAIVNGVYPWDGASDAPTTWGVLLNIQNTEDSTQQSYWRNQLAFGTDGRVYFRKSINHNNFSSWEKLAFVSEVDSKVSVVNSAVSAVDSKVASLKDFIDRVFAEENGKLKVKMSLFTDGTISALGSDGTAIGGGGGSYPRLDSWESYTAGDGSILSAHLGVELRNAVLSHSSELANRYVKSEVDAKLSGKSDSDHNHNSDYAPKVHEHNDKYYTEAEIDEKLNLKLNASEVGYSSGQVARNFNFPNYSALETTAGNNEQYFQKLMQWIKANHKGELHLFGFCRPGAAGTLSMIMYAESANADGIPQYCSGYFVQQNANTGVIFGYNNYQWYYKQQAAFEDIAWGNLTGKPTTFTPSTHTHKKADITDFAHDHNTDYLGINAQAVSSADSDKLGGQLPAYYAKASDLTSHLTSTSAHSFANISGKPTTISGYGITDALTATEINDRINAVSDRLDEMFAMDGNKIKAKHPLYSVGAISALGSDSTTISGGGGSNYTRLDNWSDYDPDEGAVLSANLGHGILEQLNSLTPRVAFIENGKSDKGHGHTINDVTGLQAALDRCKTDTQMALNDHISAYNAYKIDVQSALDGKSSIGHTHANYLTSHQDISHLLKIDGSNATHSGAGAICSALNEATGDITDVTAIVTSDNWDFNSKSYYRRRGIKLWNYINSKLTKNIIEEKLTGNIQSHSHPINNIEGLADWKSGIENWQTSLTTSLSANFRNLNTALASQQNTLANQQSAIELLNSMFTKEDDGSIRVNGNLHSTGAISALGASTTNGTDVTVESIRVKTTMEFYNGYDQGLILTANGNGEILGYNPTTKVTYKIQMTEV